MRFTPASPSAAIAAIARHHDTTPHPHARHRLPTSLTPAQDAAVRLARIAIHRFGGALIADPPGSGKSFIGLQLAIETSPTRPVLITAPAALAPTWNRLARSAGIDCHFLSHTRLSLDDRIVADTPASGFILVDEAHAFRTPSTRRYHTLARLTRDATVLLLTATPVNNSLMDLYFQLKLFLPDGALADLGVPDLLAAFRSATLAGGRLPPTLDGALRHVLIRRSRQQMRSVQPPAATPVSMPSFPTLEPPTLVRYDLDRPRAGFVHGALATLARLSLAAFAPDPSTRPPAELLRLTLAKRLESGLPAFAASLHGMVAFHLAFLDALSAHRLLRPRDRAAASDRADQLVFACVVGQPIPRSIDVAALRLAVLDDLDALSRLLADARTLIPLDPKRHALLELLAGPLRDRHILLFTEFRETAADLWSTLRDRPGTGRLDGDGAWLASGRCGRAELIRRFAPAANHAPPPPPHHAVRLLIATDILAEGVNLQDADAVISYDLPWNPVRLIQRVGRIDRLGSPHVAIDAVIFMPDHWLDEFMALLHRVESKLGAIRSALGVPSWPRLTASADRHAAFVHALAAGLAPATAADFRAPEPPDDPLAAVLDHPRFRATMSRPDPAATGAIPVATLKGSGRPLSVLLAVSSGGRVRFALCRQGTSRHIDRTTAARLLLRALDMAEHPPPTLSAAALHALHAAVDSGATIPATATSHPSATAARAIRRVLRLAAADSDDPRTAPLADRLVLRLSSGLRAGHVLAVRRWCRLADRPAEPFRRLTELDTALDAGPAEAGQPPPTILAALLLHP